VLRDDAVSLSARRVHQPFPAYASGLVADVQAVLNEVISLGGPHAAVAHESLDFFISRSLPAPPKERPPGKSERAIRERTALLQTEPVTRRSSTATTAAPPLVQAPTDGQGDDVAIDDDAAAGAASDAAGGSSDDDDEGLEASDDARDAAEDDGAADLLIEEILGQPGFDSDYMPSGSDSESDELW